MSIARMPQSLPPKKLTTYDLVGGWCEVMDDLTESGGEITPEIDAKMKTLEASADAKLIGICRLIRNFEAFVAGCRDEKARLDCNIRVGENAVSGLKGLLLMLVETFGKDGRMEAGTFKVRKQANPPSVKLSCEPWQLPDWCRVIEYKPNTKAIVDRIKAGDEVSFATYESGGSHVRIS